MSNTKILLVKLGVWPRQKSLLSKKCLPKMKCLLSIAVINGRRLEY